MYQGYSHADRVTDPSLLEPERIQQVVCSGADIFGMLPEAYRVRTIGEFTFHMSNTEQCSGKTSLLL